MDRLQNKQFSYLLDPQRIGKPKHNHRYLCSNRHDPFQYLLRLHNPDDNKGNDVGIHTIQIQSIHCLPAYFHVHLQLNNQI